MNQHQEKWESCHFCSPSQNSANQLSSKFEIPSFQIFFLNTDSLPWKLHNHRTSYWPAEKNQYETYQILVYVRFTNIDDDIRKRISYLQRQFYQCLSNSTFSMGRVNAKRMDEKYRFHTLILFEEIIWMPQCVTQYAQISVSDWQSLAMILQS